MRGDNSGNIILERDGSVRSEPESSRLAKKPQTTKNQCAQEMLMESIQHLSDSMNSRLLKLDETLTNLVQAVNNWSQNVALFNANMETLISEA